MEAVIILIVVGLIGYVFYQSLPNPKFQKANSLIGLGNFEEAIIILESIFEKHADAPEKLAECKLKQGQQAKSTSNNEALRYFHEVIEIKKRFPENAARAPYEFLEAKAGFEIASILFNTAVAVTSADSKVKHIQDNLVLIDNATKSGIEGDFSSLRKKHFYELAEIHFDFGLRDEKSKLLAEAIQHYSMAKELASESFSSTIPYNASTRIAICKLKRKPENIEFISFSEFDKANQNYAQDFYYRYVLFLLKKESYSDAETILNSHLNLPIQAIEKLKELLKTKQIQHAIRRVEEINTAIAQLYEKSFPIEDVKAIYEKLDDSMDEIIAAIPSIEDKLQGIRPSLFNRLLSHYISSEEFGNGMELIRGFPSFWERPELLKNLGICCYGYTANGNLSEDNYCTVISDWLTSVFSDKVILNSLKATSWDDNYTFTLTNAIGSRYSQHGKLPENVNYDDVTDSNISIGSTQMELLQHFESLMNETISNSSLSNTVHSFYTKEKEAIEKIVSVIEKDILFAAPHFAKSYGINEEIIKELDNDYVEYSNEESLDAGIPYLKNYSDTYVREYATAKETITNMVEAIQYERLNVLKSVVAGSKRSLIEKYQELNESVEDLLFNAFALKIEENGENKNLIPLMDQCILFVKDNEKLRRQCSNFIHNYCSAKWKTKSALKLLELMIKSVKYDPINYRAAKLLTISINNNLMDIANDETTSSSQIYSLIDDVKKIHSDVLDDALKELLLFRKKILSSLGPETAKTIMLGYSLNPNGRKLKKILDTMQTLGGDSTYSTLDLL